MLDSFCSTLLVYTKPHERLALNRCFSLAGLKQRLHFVAGMDEIDAFCGPASVLGGTDLFFVDLDSLCEEGWTALEILRDYRPILNPLVAILLSAKTVSTLDRAFNLGVGAILKRPLTPLDLVELIRRIQSQTATPDL